MKIFLLILLLFPFLPKAQSLQQQLQQCPVVIENGKINYYMPQQNGAYFQLPPARKPYYVNIMHVPWVAPLAKPVNETQDLVLAELMAQSKLPNLSIADKNLFVRKLAWCVMLQTSKARAVDEQILDFMQQIAVETDADLQDKAALALKLVSDYRGLVK
jgi:hypothetical protein